MNPTESQQGGTTETVVLDAPQGGNDSVYTSRRRTVNVNLWQTILCLDHGRRMGTTRHNLRMGEHRGKQRAAQPHQHGKCHRVQREPESMPPARLSDMCRACYFFLIGLACAARRFLNRDQHTSTLAENQPEHVLIHSV
ncbi:hypothetical protein OKW26_000265 [Paraburkholderia sp. 32]